MPIGEEACLSVMTAGGLRVAGASLGGSGNQSNPGGDPGHNLLVK